MINVKNKDTFSKVATVFSLVGALSLGACNQMESQSTLPSQNGNAAAGTIGDSTNSGAGTVADNSADIAVLNSKLDALESDIAKLDRQISGFNLLGAALAKTTPNQQGLKDVIGQLLGNLLLSAVGSTTQIDELKAKVITQLLGLNPNIPDQAKIIQQLQDLKSYLDGLKPILKGKLGLIADKVDALIARVDAQVAAMDPSKPITWVAILLWQNLRKSMVDFSNRIRNL
ncbi:MAG: hypothetical protein ABL927_03270 [Bdellovibrionales bacterium]